MGSELMVTPEPPAQAMALMGTGGAGTLAMAMMSDFEFEDRLAILRKGRDRIQAIKRELMESDVHYGVIPGTKKPALLKPGAEVLCGIFRLVADFIPTVVHGDGITSPHIRVEMRCELHLGDLRGPVVAVGYGAANSWERKHRYRRGERTCPACGLVGQVIKGKAEYGGGWLCWKSKGGCGAKWPEGAPEIEQQQVGDVENVDPYDLENTLLKMAKKRSHIDAALTGTASSDLFTQDVDEHAPAGNGGDERPARKAEPQQQATEPEGQRESSPAVEGGQPRQEQPRQASGPLPACPKCNSTRSVMNSKFKPGQLVCFKGKGGCGEQWAAK